MSSHKRPQTVYLAVVNRHENKAVRAQKIMQQAQTRIHHAKPLVMAAHVFGFISDNFAKPAADFRIVDSIAIDPAPVAAVVGRINVDAVDFSSVIRQKRFERFEIVALHEQNSGVGVACRKFAVAMHEPIRNILMMLDNRLFPNPIQFRHSAIIQRENHFFFGESRAPFIDLNKSISSCNSLGDSKGRLAASADRCASRSLHFE